MDGLQPLAAADKTSPDGRQMADHVGNIRSAVTGHHCTARQCCDLRDAALGFLGCYDDADAGGDVSMRDSDARAATAEFKLRDVEARNTALESELVQLRADKERRDDEELHRLVDECYATHKDARRLTDADRPRLMALARAGKEHLFGLFPPVPSTQQYLMRSLAGDNPRPQPPARELSEAEEINAYQREHSVGYSEASIAVRSIRTARRRRAVAGRRGRHR